VNPDNRHPAKLDYRVSLPPEHELAPGGWPRRSCAKLAAESGTADKYPGHFYREDTLLDLPNKVLPQSVRIPGRRNSCSGTAG